MQTLCWLYFFLWLFDSKDVANNSCYVITFALFVKQRNNSISVIRLLSFSHVYCLVLFISITRK